jgi:hypothetical protein
MSCQASIRSERISVMNYILASSAVEHLFQSRSGQTKTVTLVFAASPVRTQH